MKRFINFEIIIINCMLWPNGESWMEEKQNDGERDREEEKKIRVI